MAEEDLILSQSEYEHLLEEIHRLQARISELTALRDDLVYHVCPALQAEYDEKIVSLERELMAATMYLNQMQRTIEILQAQMNQQQEPSMEKAQAQAKQENKEYEEELNRKAEEAREFKKKWEESQWSKHDRQEKEQKKKASREKEQQEKEQQKKETGNGEDRHSGKDDRDGHKAGQDETGRENNESRGNDETGHKEGSGPDHDDGDDRAGTSDKEESTGRKKEDTVADKIKRLYRKIVKRLHPDVHPDLTEHEKELWNLAVKAQQEGDLAALERIWDELSGMDAPEDVFEDTPEGRAKLRHMLEKLKERLQLLELEIDHIRTSFPYTMKAFLEDPAAVEEVRSGIQAKIDNVREMNRQLEAFINELKEKLRKGEKL